MRICKLTVDWNNVGTYYNGSYDTNYIENRGYLHPNDKDQSKRRKMGFQQIHLQVEQRILQLVAWLLVQRLADQEGELVGVLAGGGHPHRARPVVVEVGQLVRQLLDVLRLEARVVFDDTAKRNVKNMSKFQFQ